MLRISIASFLIYLSTLATLGQSRPDSTAYVNRKLKVEEVNFVSSYYRQDGNNSAVTGGIGTEKLTDIGTTIDVKLSRYDQHGRKRTINAEVGVDFYTSASSDKIDPLTISSASSSDVRFYPSVSYAIANEKTGSTVTATGSASTEYDYLSFGGGIGYSKLSRDRNRELGIKGQVFFDTWSVILPVELRGIDRHKGTEPRNTFSLSLNLSQVISPRLQMMILADAALQQGQLATLFHRTYFLDGSHCVENLPDSRFKIPLGLRLNYFAGDRFVLRSFYRYYRDSWALSAHTAEIETPIKITPFFSLSPFYRYYRQNGVKYFAGYAEHDLTNSFYTSDYDLSTFTSHLFGAGVRLATPGGVLGIQRLNALELRYGHYQRSTGLASNIVTIMIKIK